MLVFLSPATAPPSYLLQFFAVNITSENTPEAIVNLSGNESFSLNLSESENASAENNSSQMWVTFTWTAENQTANLTEAPIMLVDFTDENSTGANGTPGEFLLPADLLVNLTLPDGMLLPEVNETVLNVTYPDEIGQVDANQSLLLPENESLQLNSSANESAYVWAFNITNASTESNVSVNESDYIWDANYTNLSSELNETLAENVTVLNESANASSVFLNATYFDGLLPDFSNLRVQFVQQDGAQAEIAHSVVNFSSSEWALITLDRAPGENETMMLDAAPVAIETPLAPTIEKQGKFSIFTSRKGNRMEIAEDALALLENNETVRVIVKSKDKLTLGKLKALKSISNRNLEVLEIDSSSLSELADAGAERIYLDSPMSISLSETIPLIRADLVHSQLNYTGEGIAVCLLDTGVDFTLASLEGKAVSGFDFVNNDTDSSDDNGHGTRMASVIHAVAPNATVFAVKVLGSDGIGYSSDIISGIDYCRQLAAGGQIRIISMSFGGGNFTGYCDTVDPVAEEANAAVADGLFAVASTGNDGAAYITAPACAQNATAVASISKSDTISSFSNMNGMVDLLAPGEITQGSGTSISAAHVSGAAALLLQSNSSLAPIDAELRFKTTGKLIEFSGSNYTRIDVYNAVLNNITGVPTNQTTNQSNETGNYSYIAADSATKMAYVGYGIGGGGLASWANPSYITADDTNYATATVSPDFEVYCAKSIRGLMNFSGLIPSNTNIDGFSATVADMQSYFDQTGYVISVLLVVNNSTTGTDQVDSWVPDLTEPASHSYGGASNLWGTTGLTAANITNALFGWQIHYCDYTIENTFSVDFLQITVYYSTAPTNVSSCMNLSNASTTYNLNASVAASGYTCFNVTAQNVTLDCKGYNVTGNNTDETYGLFTNQYNTIVKNCNFRNFSTDIGITGVTLATVQNTSMGTPVGLLVNNTNNSAFYNLSFTNITSKGIYVTNSSNRNNFTNISISANGGSGIYVDGGSNNSFDCAGYSITGNNTNLTYGVYTNQLNTTLKNCVISGFQHGVYWNGADNGTINNVNSTTSCYTACGAYSSGIYLDSTANYNTINKSNGSKLTAYVWPYAGIYVGSSSYNTITNTVGHANASVGIMLNTVTYSTLSNITAITTSGVGGLRMYDADNNNITNSIATGTSIYAAYIQGGSTGNLFRNVTFSSSSVQAAYIFALSNSNTFNNTTFSSSSQTGIYLTNSSNSIFANSTVTGGGATRYALWMEYANNSTIYNVTFTNPTGTLVMLNGSSSNNTFYWNNFTNTSGYYVNDSSSGINYYNSSTEGNRWFNVMNGSVQVIGSATSAGFPSLYIGTSGTGRPYNNTTSAGKLLGNVSDWYPLTPTGTLPAIAFVSPPTPDNGTTQSQNWTQINVSINASNFSRFAWNWNGTNYTVYNSSLVFMMNLNNASALGENSSSNFTYDASMYGNNGTCVGMGAGCNWTDGKYGTALYFDGSNDLVNVSNSASLNLTAGGSLEAWVKSSEGTVDYSGIIEKARNDGTFYGYAMRVRSNGATYTSVGCSFRAVNTNLIDFQFTTTAINDSQWHHWVCTYNSSSGNGSLYQDGAYAASATIAASNIASDPNNLYIGRGAQTSAGRWFKGTIDEARIWNRTLTAAQVNQSYQSNFYKYNTNNWTFITNQSNLANGTYTYFGRATNSTGSNQTETRTLTIGPAVNAAPSIFALAVVPSSPTVEQNISCNITVRDAEQSTTNVTYAWYRNGVNQTSLAGTFNNTANNTATLISNLTFGNLSVGENWSCQVQAYDGTSYSALNMSANVTIADSSAATRCRNLSTAGRAYSLSNSVSINGANCFNVTAQNVTLNCSGYNVTGNMTAGSYGLYSNQLNTSVRNCIFRNWTTAVFFNTSANRSSILNVTVRDATGTTGNPGMTVYGILLASSLNVVNNTTATNLTGGAGTAGNNGNPSTAGSNGGQAYGIHFNSSSSSNVSNFTVSSLTGGAGGRGGNSTASTANGSAGGNGSAAYAVYLTNSTSVNFSVAVVSSITGGNGGLGGNGSPTYPDNTKGGPGGWGGDTYVFYFASSSINGAVSSASISGISGGNGTGGGRAWGNSINATGGNGGGAYGIYTASSSTGIIVTASNVSSTRGGEGGNSSSFSSGSGGSSAKGGDGGPAFGVYSSTSGNAFTSLRIENTTGGIGGDGGDPPDNFQPGRGGNGGNASGIYLLLLTNNNISTSFISNVTGGNGSTGGNGDPANQGSAGAPGGNGSSAFGVQFGSANTSRLVGNNISVLNLGLGGLGGWSNDVTPVRAASGKNGTNANTFYLSSSSSTNTIANNSLNTSSDAVVLVTSSDNNTIYNNTLIGANAVSLLSVDSGASGNTFYWNNFTATSGLYVNDSSTGTNYYNTTISSQAAGNIWPDVVNRSVQVYGTVSAPFAGYLYGAGGVGYPYNNTTSSKVIGNVVDWGPLTLLNNSVPAMNSAFIGSGAANYTYEPSLMSYWKLDEPNGTTAADSSGNGNYGNVSGVTFNESGRVGRAYQFAGTTSSYVMANNTPFPSTTLTVEFWAKNENLSKTMSPVHYTVTGTNDFLIFGQANINIFINSTAYVTGVSTANTEWHHYAVTWRNSDGQLKLYIDGSLNYSNTSIATGYSYTSGGCLVLAQEQDSRCGTFDASQTLQGLMDDVRIYDRVLTATEVNQTYNQTLYRYRSAYGSANNSSDADGTNLTHIYNWYLNGTPIAVLNMPFDTNISMNLTGAVRDYSGNNNGTLGNGTAGTAPTWTSSGKVGGAYNFDGGDLIILPEPPAASTNIANGSVFAWIKTSNPGSSYRGIVVKQSAYGMFLNANVLTVYDWGASAGRSTGVSLNDGNWHFVGFTFLNGTTDGTKVYIDGALNLTTNITISNQGEGIVVGSGANPGNTQLFNGTIDQVMVFSRVLSPDQVAAMYNLQYNRIVASELAVGQVWNVSVTPNDGIADGPTMISSQLVVENSTGVDACGILGDAGRTYNLTQSVSIDGATCFNVTAQNVTLNCDGFSVTGNNTTSTYGVYSNQFNTTIRNCNIRWFQHGIYYDTVDSGIMDNDNTTITHANGYGIYLYNGANYNTVNSSRGNSSSNYGVCLSSSSNNTIANSTGTSGTTALYLSSSTGNNVSSSNFYGTQAIAITSGSSGNNFSNVNSTSTGDDNAIYSDSSGNSFAGIIASSGDGDTIYFDGGSGSTVADSSATSGSGSAILLGGVSSSLLSRVNATSNSGTAINVQTGSNNNITHSNATSNSSHGIILAASTGNIIDSSNANSTSNYAVYLYSGSNGNQLISSNATSASGKALYIDASSYNNITGSRMNTTSGTCLNITSGNYNIIANSSITSSSEGAAARLAGSHNNTLSGVNVSNTAAGAITMSSSSYNNITGSKFAAYSEAIHISAGSFNLLSGVNASSSNDVGIKLASGSNNNSITGTNSTAAGYAVYLSSSLGNSISWARANSTGSMALMLTSSNFSSISDSVFWGDDDAIKLDMSHNNSINRANSTTRIGVEAVLFTRSSNNTMNNSWAVNLENEDGISLLQASNNNTIANSNGTANGGWGIYLWVNSSGNLITNARGTATAGGVGIGFEDDCNENRIMGSTGIGYDTGGLVISNSHRNYVANSSFTVTTAGPGSQISGSNNTFTGSNTTSIFGSGLTLANGIGDLVSNSIINGNDSTYGALRLANISSSTIANCTVEGKSAGRAAALYNVAGSSTGNAIYNNTFMNATNLLYMDSSSGGNTFYWNNFTDVSGYYVNDTNGTNYYNSTNGSAASWCFQEFANVSTCGGQAVGSYYDSSGTDVYLNAYDGNWSSVANGAKTSWLLINYSKPAAAQNTSLLQVGYYSDSGNNNANYSIPSACWNQGVLQLNQTRVGAIAGTPNTYCYNGTAWTIVASGNVGPNPIFVEEGMYWNLSAASGQSMGNRWHNVMNGSVTIYSSTSAETWLNGTYYGDSSAGWPYSNSTSEGKVVGNVVDYAPFTYLFGTFVDTTINVTLINFGDLDPGTLGNPANTPVNLTNTANSNAAVDVYLNNTNMTSGPTVLLYNYTWVNLVDNSSAATRLNGSSYLNGSGADQGFVENLAIGASSSLYFWQDLLSGMTVGTYNSTIIIRSVATGTAP